MVTSDPAAIACGATCEAEFGQGTAVTLTPTADAGSMFAGWGGACTGTGACVLAGSGDAQVTATFQPLPRFRLRVEKRGSGRGRVTSAPGGIDCGGDCVERYPQGTQVVLTATPAPGHTFAGWTGGGCTGTAPCTVTLTANTTVTARFVVLTLTVRKTGLGRGRVTSDPAGIDCGGDCRQPYTGDTVVTLTATPAAGHTFVGWNGGGCTGTVPCTLTVSASLTVYARFAPPAAATSSDVASRH
jgi:uncharacterized repeat protein (TIGR02543 family)